MIGYPICADASVLFKDSAGFLRRNVVQNVHSTNGSSKYAVVFSNSIVLNTSASQHSTIPRTSDATDSPSVVSCTSVVSTIIKKVVVPYLSCSDNRLHAVQNLYKGILLVGPPGTHILTRYLILFQYLLLFFRHWQNIRYKGSPAALSGVPFDCYQRNQDHRFTCG